MRYFYNSNLNSVWAIHETLLDMEQVKFYGYREVSKEFYQLKYDEIWNVVV